MTPSVATWTSEPVSIQVVSNKILLNIPNLTQAKSTGSILNCVPISFQEINSNLVQMPSSENRSYNLSLFNKTNNSAPQAKVFNDLTTCTAFDNNGLTPNADSNGRKSNYSLSYTNNFGSLYLRDPNPEQVGITFSSSANLVAPDSSTISFINSNLSSAATQNGTQTHPYLIANINDFKLITNYDGPGKYFLQTQDIDLTSLSSNTADSFFMNRFQGNYSGKFNTNQSHSLQNSHLELFQTCVANSSISNVSIISFNISDANESKLGILCGTSSAVLTQISIASSSLDNHNPSNVANSYSTDIGGLVGMQIGGSITNIQITNINVNSIGTHANVGGLAGSLNIGAYLDTATLTNTPNDQTYTITGNNNVGGMVGNLSNLNSYIYNAHTNTMVKLNGSGSVGGLVGSQSSTLNGVNGSDHFSISNSSSTGTVNANSPSVNLGGLVGTVSGGSINASYATGSFNNPMNGLNIKAGGLIGYINSDSIAVYIQNSYATGLVTIGSTSDSNASSGSAGGFIGETAGSHYIYVSNAYATGTVYALKMDASSTGDYYVGGLVGHLVNGSLKNTFASSTVSSHFRSYVGGLIGFSENTISNYNSINTSFVLGTVAGDTAGGFIGKASKTQIYNSYSRMDNVTGTAYTGGFIGMIDSTSTTINQCYGFTTAISASGTYRDPFIPQASGTNLITNSLTFTSTSDISPTSASNVNYPFNSEIGPFIGDKSIYEDNYSFRFVNSISSTDTDQTTPWYTNVPNANVTASSPPPILKWICLNQTNPFNQQALTASGLSSSCN